MNELMNEQKSIEQFYDDLKNFMQLNKIHYKLLDEGNVNFLASDIDVILKCPHDLKKIKQFIINPELASKAARSKLGQNAVSPELVIKANTKYHFYFIIIDKEHIHAFDFSVGLVSNTGVICSGDYFFQSSEQGIDFKKNYYFLKNAAKHEHSFYRIKESNKSLYFRFSLYFKKAFTYIRTLFLRNTQGSCLVFLGADGSGKSSASDFVGYSLSVERQLFQLKKLYFKPNVFKIKPDKKFSTANKNIPHSHCSYSSVLSICKVLYVFLNYFLYSPIYFLRKKNGHLILFDRHFYDFLIDPKRYRINKAGVQTARLLSRFIPKPSAVIILTSEVSQLSTRKPGEVSTELLTQLNDRYKNFSLNKVRVCHITNDGSMNELKKQVLATALRSFQT